jgi:hypothetical protein
MAVLVSCGEVKNSDTRATGTPATEPDPVEPDDAPPTTTARAVSFGFASETSGYTSEVQVTNLEVATDVTNAPPGFTELFVEFDWQVTNTTPSRQNQLPISNIIVSFPLVSPTQNGCLTSGGSSALGSSECRVSLDFYPLNVVPAAIAPSGTQRGHYSMSVDDQVIVLPESLGLDQLRFGSVNPSCSPPCSFDQQGRPA